MTDNSLITQSEHSSIEAPMPERQEEYNASCIQHVLVKLRRTLLSENFHTPMGSSHCWLYAAV